MKTLLLLLCAVLVTGCTAATVEVRSDDFESVPVEIVGGTPEATGEPFPMDDDTGPTLNQWSVTYYNTLEPSDIAFTEVQTTQVVEADYGVDGPTEMMPVDGFAVEWVGAWTFEPGYYELRIAGMMDVELRRAGDLLMTHTNDTVPTSLVLPFEGGDHTLWITARDTGGNASIRVTWTLIGPIGTPTATAIP